MSIERKSTLRDVARISGVSYQTVWRVVNDHPSVASGTRQRVLNVVDELHYQPNPAARQLVTGKSQTIGVISYGLRHYGPAQMFTSIERALRTHKYGLVAASLDELNLGELEQAIRYVKRQLVEGIVIIVPLEINASKVKALCGVTPFILVDAPTEVKAPSISINQHSGAQVAAEHLIALGHKKIAEITGPLTWYDAHLRHEGFLAALAHAGLEPAASVPGDWTAAGGYQAMTQMIEATPHPTALFAANDQTALGAIHALSVRGLSVPDDISVVGFDDVPEASHYLPPLTTVRQDFEELGKRSVQHILSLTDGHTFDSELLEPTLIVRESTRRR